MKRITSPLLILVLSACGVAGDERVEDLLRPEAPAQPSEAVDAPPPPGPNNSTLSLNSLCGGDLAEDTFRYGLCICDDLSLAGELRTSSIRSSTGQTGLAGGVGINGNFSTAGDTIVDGSLVVGGDLIPAGTVSVAGELRTGGDLVGAGELTTGGDAFVEGEISFIGLDVGGTLHTTSEQRLFFTEAADTRVEPFTIAPPCGCEQAVPVSDLVAEAAVENDNAAAGVDAGALSSLAGEAELALGPGRYFLDGVRAAGALRVVVTGPVELFIGGDLGLAGALDVELASADATLDLFVDGDISTAGALRIGDPDRPAGVRVYLADEGSLSLAGSLDLDGALHAPGTTLAVAGEVNITGAVTVGRVSEAGSLDVVYDADLHDAGDACEPPITPEEPAPEEPAPEEPAPEEPAPEEPAPEEPAPNEAEPACEISLDCPDPEICVDGACILFEG